MPVLVESPNTFFHQQNKKPNSVFLLWQHATANGCRSCMTADHVWRMDLLSVMFEIQNRYLVDFFEEDRIMPTPAILAVAIGDPAKSRTITDLSNLNGVRPYVVSLINYLSSNGYTIGADYTVDYRECLEDNEDFTGHGAIIFCMSTPVVRKALAFSPSIPIVGVFSNPAAEGFDKTKNVCGVRAGPVFRHSVAALLRWILGWVTPPISPDLPA